MRPDGGPATLDELLDHYRKMRALHHERWRDTQQPKQRRDDAYAMATAYDSAANELERVLEIVREGVPPQT